jgi:hypothetical protein
VREEKRDATHTSARGEGRECRKGLSIAGMVGENGPLVLLDASDVLV